ncbi:RAS1 protein [Balamuthia mandrillaris]
MASDGEAAPATKTPTEYNVVLCGGGGVGKSAIIIQLTQQYFIDQYNPTIEDQYRKQIKVDGEDCVLDVWDTAGQEEYSAMRYMKSAQGFLLVYSINSKNSFQEMEAFREQILFVKEASEFPMILVANKKDLGEKERQVTKEEGERLASKFGCPYIETSAKEAVNVNEAFEQLVKLMRRFQDKHPEEGESTADKEKKKKKKAKPEANRGRCLLC